MPVVTREQIYKLRRDNMRAHLRHGDIKILAGILLEEYPDITRSSLRDFANYLAQVFNPKTKRPFKEDLARKIESVWPDLDSGDLDRSPEELEYREATVEGFEYAIEFEESENRKKENEIRLKQAEAGYKDDSDIPRVALDALKWILFQHFKSSDVIFEENKLIELEDQKLVIDLLVRDSNSDEIILIVETGSNKGLARLKKLRDLALSMELLKVKKGVLAIYDSEEIHLTWV